MNGRSALGWMRSRTISGDFRRFQGLDALERCSAVRRAGFQKNSSRRKDLSAAQAYGALTDNGTQVDDRSETTRPDFEGP